MSAISEQGGVGRVAVVGGNRIPFARSNSVYSRASNQDMLTEALDGLVERFSLQGERLGEVAETIAWLASPASTGVNGNVVRVCGQSLLGA